MPRMWTSRGAASECSPGRKPGEDVVSSTAEPRRGERVPEICRTSGAHLLTEQIPGHRPMSKDVVGGPRANTGRVSAACRRVLACDAAGHSRGSQGRTPLDGPKLAPASRPLRSDTLVMTDGVCLPLRPRTLAHPCADNAHPGAPNSGPNYSTHNVADRVGL